MSNDLKRYLLAGAKDINDSGPSPYEGDGTSTLLRRRRVPRDKRNRLSLDLDLVNPDQEDQSTQLDRHIINYRKSTSDALSNALKRRSLNLDYLHQMQQLPKRRNVHFELPDSSLPHRQGSESAEDETGSRRSRPRQRRRETTNENEEEANLAGVNPHLRQLMEVSPQTYNEAQRLKKMLKRAVSGPDATFEDLKAYRLAMKRLRIFSMQEQEKEIEKAEEEQAREKEFHSFMEKLGSSSYGSRYGTTTTSSSPGSSYLSALNRDRSSSRDRSGYGSDYGKTGYGSGSGSAPYTSSRYSGDSNAGISSIASKFGETKSTRTRDAVKSPISSYASSTRDSIKSPVSSNYLKTSVAPSSYSSSTRDSLKSPVPSTYSTTSAAASKPPTSRSRDSIKSPVSSYSPSSTTSTTALTSKPLSSTSSFSALRRRDSQNQLPQESTTSSYSPRTRDSSYNSSLKNDNSISSYKNKEPEISSSSYRTRDSGITSPRVRNNEYGFPRPSDSYSDSSFRTRSDTTSATPIRTRTRELPLSPSIPESRPSKYSSTPYTSKYGSGSNYDKSGYTSDTKSGYGSDYSISGYGSGYGSGTDNTYKRYSWSRSNSFIKTPDTPPTPPIRTYSRQNSLLGSDSGGGSSLRSRVHLDDTPSLSYLKPNPVPTQNESIETKSPDLENKKPQRPSAFQTAIGKLTLESKAKEDKKPDLLSPNAVKVLPIFDINDVKLKNKAPADFSSGSEDSDDEKDSNREKESNKDKEIKVESSTTNDLKIEKAKTVISELPSPQSPVSTTNISRPLSHLCAAPSLPTRRDNSPALGMISPPTFKKSSKYATPLHELVSSIAAPSKWLKEKETENRSPSPRSTSETNLNLQTDARKSPLPPKSPITERKNDSQKDTQISESEGNAQKNALNIGNKDYRKSVLNMDIQPEEEDIVRRKQEEKREEIRRLKQLVVEEGQKSSSTLEVEHQLDKNARVSDEDKKDSSLLCVHSDEKSVLKSKVVERKHSKGKADSLRKSGSFRRQRERSAAHASRTSSSSSSSSTSSDSDSEKKSNRSRTSSFTRLRRKGSKDEMLARTTSKERLIDGRRTRNNSETLQKTNSKSRNNSKNSLIDKSNNSSRNSLLGDKKLSIGPDIDIGENSASQNRSSSKENNLVNGSADNNIIIYTKQRKESSSSSSSSSSESDSSESAEEEGCLFSISKSKSIKKSKSGLNKLSTSPSSSQNNKNSSNIIENGVPVIECTFNIVLPRKKIKPVISNNAENSELNTKEEIQETSPLSTKSNLTSRKSPAIDYNTDGDVSEIPEYDATDALSKSSSKLNVDKTDENGYDQFAWSEGSPQIARKNVTVATNEQLDEDISTADFTEGYSDFIWPEGSPKQSRKKNYVKAEWDTDTETEMNQTEWSDGSPPASKMPQVAEETEDEVYFEWPSSPEASRKHPVSAYIDTQAETDDFDWPSSPELPEMKDPKFITFTKDIDCLLGNDKIHDSFIEMEKKLGFEIPEETKPEEETKEREEQVDKIIEEETNENKIDCTTEKKKTKMSLRDRARKNLSLFIDKLTNIDEILGSVLQPLSSAWDGDEPMIEINASDVKVHDAKAKRAQIDENIEEIDASAVIVRKMEKRQALKAEIIKAVKEGLDDATLQVYRDGDCGTYLDLEASLAEQADDIDGLTDSKKNAIILRTQLSVRVHAIIEKLLKSDGRELRRALFSLKQIFQDDKDLVHAFVHNEGLKCLVKVGSSADHNYQTYILRALGQVMLYVDGMTGISNSPETLKWLYSLVSSKFRLVVKTALKLLLVFVEYSEFNALILVKAIRAVDKSRGDKPWSIIMRLLEGKDCPDTELQIYAMTLVNKTLNGLPDQDSYYDQTDYLEEQDIETLIQKFMHNPNSDLDLLQQLTIYEAVLAYEDGDDVCRTRTIDPTIRQDLRFSNADRDDSNRRKSKRHFITPDISEKNMDDGITSSDDENRGHVTVININGGLPTDDLGGVKHSELGVTPALRRRRERAQRQKTFLNEQEMINESRRGSQSPDEMSSVEDENRKNSEISWLLELMQAKKEGEVKDIAARIASLMEKENIDNNKRLPIELTSDSCVKEILDKLSRGGSLTPAEHERLTRLGDVSGRIQKAKGDLLKAQTKVESKIQKPPEPPKKSENDIHWENLVNHLNRPLELCDLDFTDLNEDDDKDIYSINHEGIPPPPPPPPPPPMGLGMPGIIPPPPPPMENGHAHTDDEGNGGSQSGVIPPPPPFGLNKKQKSKKTIKLFWKEIRNDLLRKTPTIWDAVQLVEVDGQKLEHLFESRAKDIISKKQQDQKGIKEVIVLDSKRSNVINIGMTKLPPPRTIKTAILKMDSSIINREGIEKLLQTMLPTEEEKSMIHEAAISNPELPLGSAEQFLMMLASISELAARLKLWLFKLDFEVMEKEVAEPLMDLKQGIADLQKSKTFEIILSILLSVGNFLNSSESKGFQIDYLSKVPEVKDTVHKHSLLHHLCHIVIEKFPDTSDLYSEIGSITRASKVDFDDLLNTIEKMETECKSSWDHLKAIAKHDGPTQMKLKMSEFLADGAERIIVLGIIHRRVMHRFQRFLMWLGMPPNVVLESKPQAVCSTISEFALEYRTCRERVIQQIQKKANHRERNKTRGKMITEMEKFKAHPKTKEEEADNDLRQLLNYSDVSDTETIRGKNTWRRTREGKTRSRGDESMAEFLLLNAEGVDDALLDSLVKTATQTSTTRSTPRERKRSRHADRKSSVNKRTRTRERNLINELEALQATKELIE